MYRVNEDPRQVGWLIPVLLLLAGLQWPEARAEGYGYGPSPYPPAPRAVRSAYLGPDAEQPGPATAPANIPLTEVEARVSAAMEDEIAKLPDDGTRYSYRIDPIDPRLRLAQCPVGLEVERQDRGTMGRATFRVSCRERNPWSIHVSGEIEGWRQVLVAARPLRHRSVIDARDVRLAEQNVAELHRSYYEDPAEVQGLLLKRSLRENEVLTARNLSLPRLVRRGQPVQIVASSGAVQVRSEGIALSDGAEGDLIRVRNPRSGRIIQAEVTDTGEVYVRL